MKRLKKHLDSLERKLSEYEGEGVEIKLNKKHPMSREIDLLLESKKRYYLTHSFHFLY